MQGMFDKTQLSVREVYPDTGIRSRDSPAAAIPLLILPGDEVPNRSHEGMRSWGLLFNSSSYDLFACLCRCLTERKVLIYRNGETGSYVGIIETRRHIETPSQPLSKYQSCHPAPSLSLS